MTSLRRWRRALRRRLIEEGAEATGWRLAVLVAIAPRTWPRAWAAWTALPGDELWDALTQAHLVIRTVKSDYVVADAHYPEDIARGSGPRRVMVPRWRLLPPKAVESSPRP